MSITLNGQDYTLPAAVSVRDLIVGLRLDADAVAVERNREIVRRQQWSSTQIQPGDRVEIVHFVGGG